MPSANSRGFLRSGRLVVRLMVLLSSLIPTGKVCLADSPAETAAEKLAWEVESRRAIEVRVRTEIANRQVDRDGPSRKQAFDTSVEHYIETSAGQRYNEFQGLLDGVLTARMQNYGDGRRFAHVDYDPKNLKAQQSIYITRQYWQEERSDKRNVPDPLLYHYVGRQPLFKALAKAEYLGEGQSINRTCDVFLFPQVPWLVVQDQVFYLDRETATPLKVAAFRNDAERQRDEPVWVWEAESLDSVSGHPITLTSTKVQYDRERNPAVTWRQHIESIEFDKDYPASQFWPTIQPSATVLDSLTKQVKPGEKAQQSPAATEPSTSSPPLQAVPSKGWAADLSTISLILGSAVLIAAVVLWKRR